MKQMRYIAITAAVVLSAACSKEMKAPQVTELTITASFAENQTRTSLQDGGTTVYWEPDDEITVFRSGSAYKFTANCTETSVTSTFTGTFKIEDYEKHPSSLVGLYPYSKTSSMASGVVTTSLPSKQIGRKGTFAKGANVSLGKMDGSQMSFFNIGGGIRFTLTHDGVRKIIIQGNNNENLSGKFKTTFENERPVVQSVTEGSNTVILSAPSGETFEKGKWYYITLLPGSLSKGFTMKFITSSTHAVLETSKTAVIKRGIFLSVSEIDKNLEYKDTYTLVDLGLSVKWATCNIGALIPEEYGDYYAWGETEPRNENSGLNCKYGVWVDYTLYVTKYCRAGYPKYWYNYSPGVNEPDNILTLEASDDVAHVDIGGGYHIPTYAEWLELKNKCTWQLARRNGVLGKLVTSHIQGYEGNSIFLPPCGRFDGSMCIGKNSEGYYWTSSLSRRTDCCNCGTNVRFAAAADADWVAFDDVYYRCDGMPIRPVCSKQ